MRIKIRGKSRLSIAELVEEQRVKYEEAEEDKSAKGQKEKKICEVVEKVGLWRKFYTGFYDESRNYVQRQLDVAAQEVGIAKKTLDDYLLQIRNGKKYGFNFN